MTSCFLLIMQLNIELGKVNSTQLVENLNKKKKQKKVKEAIIVKKKGSKKAKMIKIDEEQHEQFSKVIKKMTDKNNCYDLFQNAIVGNRRMFEEKPVIKMLRYKFDRRNLMNMYGKLRLIISLRAVEGELFILLLLQSIKLAKEIFVLEIEQGLETFIPPELS